MDLIAAPRGFDIVIHVEVKAGETTRIIVNGETDWLSTKPED